MNKINGRDLGWAILSLLFVIHNLNGELSPTLIGMVIDILFFIFFVVLFLFHIGRAFK